MTTSVRALCGGVLLAAPLLAGVGLHFEENRGQTDERVEWLARGPGYSAFVSGDGAVFGGREGSVRMRLAGARRGRGEGLEALPGVSHYLRGGDGSGDVTGVRHFGKVRYKGVYPGVDLVYYGNERQLEYDFVVAAGADPSRIRLRFEGVGSLRTDAEGNLALGAGLVLRKPVLYQETGGARREVRGAFRVRGREVSFDVGRYRRDLPLVIDPVLAYASYLGGSGYDTATALGLDAAGNVYVGGYTHSWDFPGLTPAVFAGRHVFVSKFDPTGARLLRTSVVTAAPSGDWSGQLDGFAVLPDGRVALAGIFPGIRATPGSYVDGRRAGTPSHAAILNSSGDRFQFVVELGFRTGRLAVDSQSRIALTGSDNSSVLLRLSADGSSALGFLTWEPIADDVAVDSEDNILLASRTANGTVVRKYNRNGTLVANWTAGPSRTTLVAVGPETTCGSPGHRVAAFRSLLEPTEQNLQRRLHRTL